MAWLISSSVAILASALASAVLYSSGRLDKRTWWVPAITVLALPVFGFGLAASSAPGSGTMQTPVAGASSIAWPGSGSPPLASAAPANEPVAPVSSLVDGLKARLEQQPADGGGWALLATSYAFIGQQAAADDAVAKAVALGVDEAVLRQRVQEASRSSQAAQAPSWADTAAKR